MDFETALDSVHGGWAKQFGDLVMTFADGSEYHMTEDDIMEPADDE